MGRSKKQNYVVVFEPSARILLDWTPQQIRTAEILADAGNLRLASDLCEALMADDRIQGVLRARTRGLLGLKLDFEKSGDRRKSGKAIRALEVEEDWWAAYPESELAPLLDWGIILGVGLSQQIPTDRENGRVVPKLSRYHTRWLRQDPQKRAWFVQTEGSAEIQIVPGDGRWVLHVPGGGNRPWADGAWRALSRWWLLKHMARQDFALHSEVHGQPIRLGVGAAGSDANQRRILAQQLKDLGRETGMALPPGWDMKLVEAKASTWEMFRAQIQLADSGTTIVLAGQNLTTDVSGGSLAAAQVHKIIRNDIIRFDDESIGTTIHDQSLVHWAEWNYGDRNLAPWPSRDTDPPEDELAAAQVREQQGKAIVALKDAGVKLDPVLEEFGLEMNPDSFTVAN